MEYIRTTEQSNIYYHPVIEPHGEEVPRTLTISPGEELPINIALPTRHKQTGLRRNLRIPGAHKSMRSRLAQAGLEFIGMDQTIIVNWGSAPVTFATTEVLRTAQDESYPRINDMVTSPSIRKGLLSRRALPNWMEEFLDINPELRLQVERSRTKYALYLEELYGLVPIILPVDNLFILDPDKGIDLRDSDRLSSHRSLADNKQRVDSWQQLIDIITQHNLPVVKINGIMPNFSIPKSNWGFICGRAPLNSRYGIYNQGPFCFGSDLNSTDDIYQLIGQNQEFNKVIPHGGSCIFDPGFNMNKEFPGVAELVLTREQIEHFAKTGHPYKFELPFMIMPWKRPALS